MSRRLLPLLLAAIACHSTSSAPAPRAASPLTRAERSGYTETSTYLDVIRFLDTLRIKGAPYRFSVMDVTTEKRALPYVIASRPLVSTPAEARASGKPIVYVQGNIHAGEVEGKEAVQALLRDLAFTSGPSILDSIILIAVPIYNADGNERFAPQDKQRTEQNGPVMVGQRPNAQNLDLNRDYIKAEAPETRASLEMFNAWDPDVFVDLHTTDGSLHGYNLTYSPSLNPASPLGDYSRIMLAELRKRVLERHGFQTFDYGNFNDRGGLEVSTDSMHHGWYTYDHRPRFGTNYYGLRNRISVLSEAFSHDPFEVRVKSTYAFVRELLTLVAERGADIKAMEARTAAMRDGVALRSALPKTAASGPVRFEILERTGDTLRTQPGMPKGVRRTGEIRTRDMPIFDRFEPTLVRPLPALYVFAHDSALIARLHMQGIRTELATTVRGPLEEFVVDSLVRSARPFQGHNETRLEGRWRAAPQASLENAVAVRMDQPLARLAMYLLDPESDDGFVTWNVFDARIGVGRPYPVLRLPAPSVR